MRRLAVIACGFTLVITASGCSANTTSLSPTVPDAQSSSDVATVSAINLPAPRVVPEIVGQMRHDPTAFTQGLVWHRGRLYESTGLYGNSQLRETRLGGEVVRHRSLTRRYFGEGLALHGPHLYQLTWKEGRAFVWRRDTLRRVGVRRYRGEGWGLATLGRRLIMSDGTAVLRVVEPSDFRVVRRIRVTDGGTPVRNLNELEMVNGELWANVWQSDDIVVINPTTGHVRLRLDLSSLRARLPAGGRPEVLNGIAWNRETNQVLVTGKWWPRMFALRLPVPDQ